MTESKELAAFAGDAGVKQLFVWRLRDHADSRNFRRLDRELQTVGAKDANVAPWVQILRAILLLETSQRGALLRAVERTVAACWRGRATTCGPLQMRSAPWALSEAACAAAEILSTAGSSPYGNGHDDLSLIARTWNGAASRQPGAVVGYAGALLVALEVLQERD